MPHQGGLESIRACGAASTAGGCTAQSATAATLPRVPAAVLHGWDFNLRPVCEMAADFLASIAQQPLLCVGAVNPGARLSLPSALWILRLFCMSVRTG
jgi:hypothetical protein